MSYGSRIKELRKARGISAERLSEMTGISPATIYRYENGTTEEPKSSMLRKIASALGVDLWQIVEFDSVVLDDTEEVLPHNVRMMPSMKPQLVPMIGRVAAGEPIYDPEELGVYVESPVDCDAAIEVQGESMLPTYLPGDTVYIKCRPDVSEGSVAVVFLDDEAVIKHVYKRPTGLTLISDNPEYPPLMPEFADYANIRVFGIPVGFTRLYKENPLKNCKGD